MLKKRLIIIVSIVAFILLIPLIAMQITDEVNWTLMDFVIGGILLFGFGLLLDFVFRTLSESKYKYAVGIVVVIVFILICMELAVGIFGTPFAGN